MRAAPKRRVEIVCGFGGWYIRRCCIHILRQNRYFGPYSSRGVAVTAAKLRGYRIHRMEPV